MLRVFTDDRKADYFAELPPIVVFFGWAALTFTPWLVLITSAESIAAEVASRSIRYAVLRTGRLQFALGKMAGQLMIVLGVTALSALTFYLVAWASMSGFAHGETIQGLISYWPRVVLFTLPFLAWAMFASMLTSSANLARVVSFGGTVILSALSGLSTTTMFRRGPISDGFWDLYGYLVPFKHDDGLFYPPGATLLEDVIVLLVLTALYFSLGFAILKRRDL